MADKPKLQTTSDYSMFVFHDENRVVDISKFRYKKLRDSLKKYGFIPAYPLHCRARGNRLEVFDGHRRFTAAKELSLPVWYIIYNNGQLNLAEINDAQEKWTVTDFIESMAQRGVADYRELLEFSRKYRLPIGMSAGLLAGCVGASGEIGKRLRGGTYAIKDRETSSAVASIVSELHAINKVARHSYFLNAMTRCVRVREFDASQFVEKARKLPAKFIPQPDVQSFLRMIDEIYNYHAQKPIPLAFMANEASKGR